MVEKNRDILLLVGRVLSSLLFLIAGYNKIIKHDFYVGYFSKLGVPLPSISVPGAMIFEIVGGAGTLRIGDLLYSEMEPFRGGDGSLTTLQNTVFSTVFMVV